MRIPETRAAVSHAKWVRQDDGYYEPELPDKFIVHALLHQRRPPKWRYSDTEWQKIIDFKGGIDYEGGTYRAACHRQVKVVLPFEFSDADPDACRECLKQAHLFHHHYDKWEAQLDEWQKEQDLRRDVEEYMDVQERLRGRPAELKWRPKFPL